MSLITIVIPVYNEEACLEQLHARLLAAQAPPHQYEYIFVDDGSTDRSREILLKIAQRDPQSRHLFFSRNFGHEAATTAGLDHASGDAVVIIDADLQDPPEVIPLLLQKWSEGYQVVYAQRRARKGEGVFKRFTSWLFYRIIGSLSDVKIPADTGDFRLMDQRVVLEFRRCRERSRFVRGLVAWTGFRQTAVPYDRDARAGGETKYSLFKLVLLALDSVVGFSVLPLRLATLLGLIVCLLAFIRGVVSVILRFTSDTPIGYTLLVTGVFFLGGAQMFMLGLLGEYMGRTYRESQHRPLYIVWQKSDQLPTGEEGHYSE